MARSTETTNSGLPALPDQKGQRHFGDGIAGEIVAARLQGFYASAADYRDVAVDSAGNLLAALTASAIEIGTVDQGAGGASAWKVDGSAVTQPVSGTFWQATQPVSLATNTPDVTDRSARLLGHVTVDSAPTTPVTGPLTDAQLRATPVPVSAAALPLPTGASTDTTFAQAVGVASIDPPAYGTVLDRLIAIERAVTVQGEALAAALVPQPSVAPSAPTLLHRS